MNEKSSSKKLPRREFLANLLFAGTALSVAGLQTEYDLVARKDPKEEGWKLPEDWKKSEQTDGWELPDDLLENSNQPEPPPHPRPKPPPPQPPGGIRPPQIRGKYLPPADGDVEAPKRR